MIHARNYASNEEHFAYRNKCSWICSVCSCPERFLNEIFIVFVFSKRRVGKKNTKSQKKHFRFPVPEKRRQFLKCCNIIIDAVLRTYSSWMIDLYCELFTDTEVKWNGIIRSLIFTCLMEWRSSQIQKETGQLSKNVWLPFVLNAQKSKISRRYSFGNDTRT